MNLTLISAAIAAALGFGTAWSIQSQRITKMELTYAETRIANQSAARKVLERVTLQVSTAQNDAVARGRVLRADAAAARNELDKLRRASDNAVRAATASLDACTGAVVTYSGLLDSCGRALTDLGAKADGHASDVRTLTDAWPR